MDEVTSVPQLQRRGNGVYYFRVRLPAELLRAIATNPREWKRRTTSRGNPLESWKRLASKDGLAKKELLITLGTRDARVAKRELPLKQIEFHQLAAEITRHLTGERTRPSMKDVEQLAHRWFATNEEKRRLANLSYVEPNSEIEDQLREDVANAQSRQFPGSDERVAETLLSSGGFEANPSTQEFRALVQLVERGSIERAKRALADYLGDFGQAFDNFYSSPASSIGKQGKSSSYSLKQLTLDYLEDRKSHLNNKSVVSYQTAFRVALDTLGETTPVEGITRDDCRRYVAILRQLPSNHTKHKSLDGLTTSEAAVRGTQLGLKPISVSTANGYLSRFATLLEWAFVEDKIAKNPTHNLSTGIEVLAKSDRRNSFTRDDLTKIFSAPLFTGCIDDEENYNRPDANNHPRRSRFWAQLISLFMGLRLNEILQADIDDLDVIDGITCLRIRPENKEGDLSPNKKLKTTASRRTLPIHPELIRIGFLTYVDELKERRATRVFPETKVGSDGYFSTPFSKWHSRYLASIGVKTSRRSFHSFRHNFRDAQREAGLDAELAYALGGWTNRSAAENYGGGFSMKALFSAMSRIKYDGLDLSHLYWE